ncbi:ABC transporter substrate-binding protein [Halosegnis marinus]|uniref:ABC transporter substrate-binding protein n=1 Tax=Halosegnis marinus TaxID=3034023 RepID=A0ABD5ZMU9_9EURY|nr:ABC transporter substrate-binding protein [Halosegnis sp. DT85]
MSNDHTDQGTNGSSRLTTGIDRRKFLTATGAGATAAVAGCSGLTGGGGDTIKIGGVYLLSGIASALGTASANAARVAVEQINEDGGIDGQEVELEVRDHGEDPQAQIRSVAQEYNADVMIGLTSSGVTLGSAPTIESLGVPFTLTDIGTPYITEYDTDAYGDYFEADDGKAAFTPNMFRANSMTSHMTYAIAKYVADNYGAMRVANMGPNYAYGQQCWEYFQAYSEGLGVDHEYVASEFPELGASDMTPQINSVLSADPDLVFTSFWAGDTTTFISQAADQGLFDEVEDVFDTIGADPTVYEALGDTTPEGIHMSGWYWPTAYDNENNQAFLDAYEERFSSDDTTPNIPGFTGGSTWAAIYMYKQAIEAAGSTNADDIISEMEGLTLEEDPRGPVTINEDSHQANAPCVIGETSFDVDVPYDGAGLANTQTYTLTRSRAEELLEGSGLGPGI